eukprot:10709710-Alexandrium_andersonii.AAC.1
MCVCTALDRIELHKARFATLSAADPRPLNPHLRLSSTPAWWAPRCTPPGPASAPAPAPPGPAPGPASAPASGRAAQAAPAPPGPASAPAPASARSPSQRSGSPAG